MKTHQRIISSVGVALVTACLPAVAQANPLLSGYGGPGQGNQAILGATLLNGPGGGGGSGTVSAASSNDELGSESIAAAESTSSRSRSPARGRDTARAHGKSPAPAGRVDAESTYRALERSANVSGDGSLGLSASEVALIIVALAAMAIIGTITRWAARTRPAKGHG